MLLAWVTFPAGGVYPWVWIPAACGLAALAVFVRPPIAQHGRVRSADVFLFLSGIALLLQLAPMPPALLSAIDPHASSLRAAIWLQPAGTTGSLPWLPISIVPSHTLAAVGVFIASLLLFWICRQICRHGGTGRIVRAIAMIGLAASVAAIVQRAQNPELLYGLWRPLDAGARPYGPFVNRNHFATWVVMACPLVFGYLLARAPERRRGQLAQRAAAAILQLGSFRIWLVAAICVMVLALLISTSRSGVIGMIGAMTTSLWLSRRRTEGHAGRWTILQGALLVVVAISFANFDSLAARLDETFRSTSAGRGRGAIWADAWRVVEDFPVTGTGAGTFGTAIAVYQKAEPGYAIGQAHNHYLQLLAEGGGLIGVPAALAAGAFFLLFRRRLAEDGSPDYLIRAGAVAGIVGALVQSFWETGLRMPANAMLLAVLAAIATHTTASSLPSRQQAD